MTLEECTTVLAPAAIALGARLDVPTFRAYHRALQDVPLSLLEAALETAQRTPREPYEPAFPPARRLRALAEQARHALIAAHPYEGCCECEDQRGWRTVTHADGAIVERCPGFRRHQEKLAQLGLGSMPLALPAAQPDRSDWTTA